MLNENQKKIMAEGLGASFEIEMDWDELKKVEAALEKDPDNFILWNAKGILYFNEDLEKSLDCFNHCLAIKPFSANQLYNRGRKYLSLDKYWEALVDLQMAIKLDGTECWHWEYLGIANYWLRRYDDAIEAFKKGIEAYHKYNGTMGLPQSDWIWTCYCEKGEVEKAQEYVKSISPELIEEQRAGHGSYIKRIELRRGEISVEAFESAINFSNDSSAATELYGLASWHYYVLKDTEKALGYVDRVLALKKGHHSWGYKMAKVANVEWRK